MVIFMMGCSGRPLEIERKVYHTLAPDSLTGKTFDIIILQDDQRDTIEFKQHSETLAGYLVKKGMKRVASSPDYIVTFDFTISGESKTGVVSTPHFTTTGGTSSFSATTYGGGRPSTTYGTVNSAPTTRYAGSSSNSYDYTEYTRQLNIRMYHGKSWSNGKRDTLFEAQAYSQGSMRNTTKLVPAIIAALMYDFPAISGTSNVERWQTAE